MGLHPRMSSSSDEERSEVEVEKRKRQEEGESSKKKRGKKSKKEEDSDSDSGVGSEVEDVDNASGDDGLDTSVIITGPRRGRAAAAAAEKIRAAEAQKRSIIH